MASHMSFVVAWPMSKILVLSGLLQPVELGAGLQVGVNASAEEVLGHLVRQDTALAFNISEGDVTVTGISQVAIHWNCRICLHAAWHACTRVLLIMLSKPRHMLVACNWSCRSDDPSFVATSSSAFAKGFWTCVAGNGALCGSGVRLCAHRQPNRLHGYSPVRRVLGLTQPPSVLGTAQQGSGM